MTNNHKGPKFRKTGRPRSTVSSYPHAHKCSQCGTIWEHDPDELRYHEATAASRAAAQQIHENAHTCPNCGPSPNGLIGPDGLSNSSTIQWFVYKGEAEATCHNNGCEVTWFGSSRTKKLSTEPSGRKEDK